MTDNFKEIGSLFGREGAGAGFVKQTDKESFTYAFAWPDGETARVEGYFTVISRPGSGAKAVDDIRHGITPGGYDISVESHDCTSGRNALAADAPAMDAPGKDDQNIE